MPSQPKPSATPAASSLREARYSLKELLQEVEYERQHSVLGLELVDQGEIGAIFKTRPRPKPAKRPQA